MNLTKAVKPFILGAFVTASAPTLANTAHLIINEGDNVLVHKDVKIPEGVSCARLAHDEITSSQNRAAAICDSEKGKEAIVCFMMKAKFPVCYLQTDKLPNKEAIETEVYKPL